jgi:hypothetical protein
MAADVSLVSRATNIIDCDSTVPEITAALSEAVCLEECAEMRNPYERSAIADDIRRSFRPLAEKLPPDANKSEPIAGEFITATHETFGKGRGFWRGRDFHRGEFGTKRNPMPKEVAAAITGVTLSVTGLLVALAIIVASPLITRSLMPPAGFFANSDGGDRNSRVGPDEKRALAAELGSPAIQSKPRVVSQQSASHVAADSIPLGIRVDGVADGMAWKSAIYRVERQYPQVGRLEREYGASSRPTSAAR